MSEARRGRSDERKQPAQQPASDGSSWWEGICSEVVSTRIIGDKMASNSTGVASAQADDSFELYDLRVEVVCPPGERIMCGAKDGDHFTLEGEMMYLPPEQGISIYSLGKLDA